MVFAEKNYRYLNETDKDIFGNRIIILKRVKSLKQLRRTEKELVRLNYKEAIIKGFTLKGIQQYIATKTKIWIEWSCLESLKKAEEQENREWYYHMARDHFAYVGAYRKCIDEIDLLKKEMWNIMMDSNTPKETKIMASKELHSLSKTYTLLIKDLPFVTNLTKFYDQDMLNSNFNSSLKSKGTHSNKNEQDINKNPIEANNFDIDEDSDNHLDCNINKNEILNGDTKDNDNGPKKYKNLDDEIFEKMQAQLNYNGTSITKEHLEGIKRIKEIFDD